MATTASSTIGGYTITRREPVDRLEGQYLELEHQRTGARHIHIECPDDNNGFAVFFPTPPNDSTGVAHILEHVVLAGSQRFPVRDPFFSMTRRSLATPGSAVDRAIGQTLFPGLPYSYVSGGDPQYIPDLTWDQLRRFHERYYHPSNARFYSYGNLPLEATLEVIERDALARFQRLEIDSSIRDVKRFKAPATRVEAFPATAGEDNTRKAQALTAWVTVPSADSFRALAMKVLTEVLLSNAGSPLRKALIDSGLGSALADGTGLHDDYKESVFGAGLKGIAAEDAEKVEKVVLETLERLADGGVSPTRCDCCFRPCPRTCTAATPSARSISTPTLSVSRNRAPMAASSRTSFGPSCSTTRTALSSQWSLMASSSSASSA